MYKHESKHELALAVIKVKSGQGTLDEVNAEFNANGAHRVWTERAPSLGFKYERHQLD